MANQTNPFYARGSITIYLALTITIIMSLVFSVIESARITSIKVRTKAVTHSSLNSSFSHFALQLYEKYGIFGVFSSEDDFISLIEDYADKNINVSQNFTQAKISDLSYNNIFHLTDGDGIFFANQAVAFEKYRSIDTIASDIYSKITTTDIGSISDDVILVDPNMASNIGNTKDTSENSLYKDLPSNEASSLKENIVNKVVNLLKSNLLLLFVENPSLISNMEISKETMAVFPSNTCVLSDTVKAVQAGNIKDSILPVVDKGFFISYLDNSFSSYNTEINSRISLKYQKEYILGGNSSDQDNLLSAAMSMVIVRAGFNLAYLMTDTSKRSAAFNLANSICVSIPGLSQIVALIILSAWAYGEGILDTRDLFREKKVPLIKSDKTWTLSLEGILSLNKSTISNNDGDIGYDYDFYLNLCLSSFDQFKLYYRTMDLIQLDLCENTNPNFLMAACIVGVDVKATYSAKPLFINTIQAYMPASYSFTTNMVYGYD